MSPTLGKRPQAIITFQRSGLEAPRPIPSAPRPQQPFRPGGGRVGRLGGLQPWFRSTTMSSQGGPAGMVNLGNTCYLNAVLQVRELFATGVLEVLTACFVGCASNRCSE